MAKTSLFLCFENSPRETFGHRSDRPVFLKRHRGFFAISCSDTELTSARIKLIIFVRPDLLESVGILFELPTPANGKK